MHPHNNVNPLDCDNNMHNNIRESYFQAGLEQELDQLLAVQEVVDAAELKHVSVYLSQGGNQEALRRRRTLQAASPPTPVTRVVKEPLKGFGPYTTCGTLCQVTGTWGVT